MFSHRAALLLLASAATSVSAAAFQATNYNWGCSPGGCANSFNLTFSTTPEIPSAPGFDVVCNGVFIQSGYRRCASPSGTPTPDTNRVETIWTDGPDRERQYIAVSHIYLEEGAEGVWRNNTGKVDFLPVRGMGFEIPVTIFETLPQ